MQTNQSTPNPTPSTTISQPTNTPSSITPISSPNSNRKMQWFVAVLVVLLFGAFGTFAFKYYILKKQLADQYLKPLPTPSTISTVEWETFIHPTYKYQFKYPKSLNQFDWPKENQELENFTFVTEDFQVGVEGVINGVTLNGAKFQFIVEPLPNSTFVTNRCNFVSTTCTYTEFDGYSATYILRPHRGKQLFFEKDNLLYSFEVNVYDESILNEYLTLFHQILSTFKFVD